MSEDLIKRSDAIKAIENLHDCYNGFSDTYDKACIIGVLEEVPSADVPETNVGDMISRQATYDKIDKYFGDLPIVVHHDMLQIIEEMPTAHPNEEVRHAYEQGRIMGHVEMRTELLMQLKEIVGDEVWANI